ncbi:MAG: hypothetical protein IKC90_00150, partial [Akkermansia sp.]|nr:hypothetical protein [Akkermansia sp.]
NPRYKNEEDIAQVRQQAVEDDTLSVEKVTEESEEEKRDVLIPLTPPRPLRVPPILPLEI